MWRYTKSQVIISKISLEQAEGAVIFQFLIFRYMFTYIPLFAYFFLMNIPNAVVFLAGLGERFM